MCPMCISTAALLAAGTGVTAGLAGLVFARRRPKAPSPPQSAAPKADKD